MIQKIYTPDAPAAIGPYSQAYLSNDLLFTSGQIPVCPQSGAVVGDTVAEQTLQVLKNIDAILKACGLSPDQVIKTTCFLADMKYFAEFNEVYATYFTGSPARSCVAVKELPKQVLCEIEVIAVK